MRFKFLVVTTLTSCVFATVLVPQVGAAEPLRVRPVPQHSSIIGKTPIPNSVVSKAPLVAVLVGETGSGIEADDALFVYDKLGVNHAGKMRRVAVSDNTRLEADLSNMTPGWYVAKQKFTFNDGHPSGDVGSPWWVFGVKVKTSAAAPKSVQLQRVTPDASMPQKISASLSGARVGARSLKISYKSSPSDVFTWSLQSPLGVFGTTNIVRAKKSATFGTSQFVLPFAGTYKLSFTHYPNALSDPMRSITWSTLVSVK